MVEAMRLRAVLRDPQLMAMHPEPPGLMLLRVCDEYAPHVSAQVFNFTTVAAEVGSQGRENESSSCECLRALRPGVQLYKYSREGHVCTSDLSLLMWPYLRQLGTLGRKFRLSLPLGEVEAHLEQDLQAYVAWYGRSRPHLLEKLQRWAAAVRREAMSNARKNHRQ